MKRCFQVFPKQERIFLRKMNLFSEYEGITLNDYICAAAAGTAAIADAAIVIAAMIAVRFIFFHYKFFLL